MPISRTEQLTLKNTIQYTPIEQEESQNAQAAGETATMREGPRQSSR